MDHSCHVNIKLTQFIGYHCLFEATTVDVTCTWPPQRHPDECKDHYTLNNVVVTCKEGFVFSTEAASCMPEEEVDC